MTGDDPLLGALASARERKQQADREIRLLLAYAREISMPRPYRLADPATPRALPSPASAWPTPRVTSSKRPG